MMMVVMMMMKMKKNRVSARKEVELTTRFYIGKRYVMQREIVSTILSPSQVIITYSSHSGPSRISFGFVFGTVSKSNTCLVAERPSNMANVSQARI